MVWRKYKYCTPVNQFLYQVLLVYLTGLNIIYINEFLFFFCGNINNSTDLPKEIMN